MNRTLMVDAKIAAFMNGQTLRAWIISAMEKMLYGNAGQKEIPLSKVQEEVQPPDKPKSAPKEQAPRQVGHRKARMQGTSTPPKAFPVGVEVNDTCPVHRVKLVTTARRSEVECPECHARFPRREGT